MKNNKRIEIIFDKIIKYAAVKQGDKLAHETPSEKELAAKYTFSCEFEEKMQGLFVRQKRYERNVRLVRTAIKIAAAIFISLSVSAIAVMSVEAWRVRVLNFISEISGKSTTIQIYGRETDYDRFLTEAREIHLPTYIPDEYKTESIEKVDDFYLVTYKNYMGDMLELIRLPIGASIGIDSEDAFTEQIIVNGQPALYSLKNEIGNLFFKYNENAFLISGQLTKEELTKIAESMKYRE